MVGGKVSLSDFSFVSVVITLLSFSECNEALGISVVDSFSSHKMLLSMYINMDDKHKSSKKVVKYLAIYHFSETDTLKENISRFGIVVLTHKV